MLRLPIGPGRLSHRLRLKPDAGDQSFGPDGLHGLLYAAGEQRPGNLIISQGVLPAVVLRLIPPGVHHKVGKALAPEAGQLRRHALLRGDAPGGAVFIEEQRQRRGGDSHVHGVDQAAGRIVHVLPPADGEIGRRTLEARAGPKGLAPVAEAVIGQAAGQGHGVVLPADLHLPGGVVGQQAAPKGAVFRILQHHPREPPVHRQRAHLTEALPAHPVTGPGGLQI